MLVKRGCPYCRMASSVINLINLRLPVEKRIRIIDNFHWEEFRVDLIPAVKILSRRGFDSYPFIYIDGVVVDNVPTPKILKTYLNTLLQGDFIF